MRQKQNEALGGSQKMTIGVLYGFRALMILLVYHFHIWQQSWLSQVYVLFGLRINLDFLARAGYVMVDGLLLLSGFLLFLPYVRERAEGIPAPSTKQFYINRVARIVPSYLVAIIIPFFLIALPQHRYYSLSYMGKDILTHLTFTFNFFKDTGLHTPLNAALWTVAVEMQFYLIFPVLARFAQEKPVATLGFMGFLGVAFRFVVCYLIQDTSVLVNQMMAFLDIYALGMLGAILYVHLTEKFRAMGTEKEKKEKLELGEEEKEGGKGEIFLSALPWIATAVFLLSVLGLGTLMKVLAAAVGAEQVRIFQMLIRLPFGMLMLVAMLSACFMWRPLQKLLDNRVMRFLAAISFHLYIWHQMLAVELRGLFFAEGLHENKEQQIWYSLICAGVALLAAVIGTYGIEKPGAKLVRKIAQGREMVHEGSETTEA